MALRVLLLLLFFVAACGTPKQKHPPAQINIGKKQSAAPAAAQVKAQPKKSDEKIVVYGTVQRRCRISDRAASGETVKLVAGDEPIATDVAQPDGSFHVEAAYQSGTKYELEIDTARAHLPGKQVIYQLELILPCADPAGRVGNEPPIALKVVAQTPPNRRRNRLNTGNIGTTENLERIPADRADEPE